MRPTLNLTRKVAILKRLEDFGYSIAYYILLDRELAAEATKAALLEVSKENAFFGESMLTQQKRLKKTVMKAALQVKINA